MRITLKKGVTVMNYTHSEITFPSRDGIHTVCADIYAPVGRAPRGIVQLSHGMIDYVERYEELADYLTGEGFILAGNNHLGHGKTAADKSELGFFATADGVQLVIKDLHTMNKYLRATYPELPVVMLGHSMGSFLARLYAVKYPHSIKGLIINGTAGKNPILPIGNALVSLIKLFRGEKYRSKLIAGMAFSGYNSKFPKSEGNYAWLTRDVARVASRDEDPYTSFIFTVSAYSDLFRMLGDCNKASWFKSFPKEMPTLIVSGDMDPVGNYGKGPDFVYKQLLLAGCCNVSLKLYDGARHELFNEINREEYFGDLTAWLEGIIK